MYIDVLCSIFPIPYFLTPKIRRLKHDSIFKMAVTWDFEDMQNFRHTCQNYFCFIFHFYHKQYNSSTFFLLLKLLRQGFRNVRNIGGTTTKAYKQLYKLHIIHSTIFNSLVQMCRVYLKFVCSKNDSIFPLTETNMTRV